MEDHLWTERAKERDKKEGDGERKRGQRKREQGVENKRKIDKAEQEKKRTL